MLAINNVKCILYYSELEYSYVFISIVTNNIDLLVISIALCDKKWSRQKSKRLKLLIIHVVNVHTRIPEIWGGGLFVLLPYPQLQKKRLKNDSEHPGCILVRNKPALFKITEIWGVVYPAASFASSSLSTFKADR